MDANLLEAVLALYGENKWREILQLKENSDDETARKILWVWPSENNLEFIREIVLKFRLEGVISIGCGCGLFEWLLQQSSGLPVVGYEVNQEWWNSRYCNPQFIKLDFPNLPPSKDALNPSFALLFCYFNNGGAFIDYVRCYEGSLILIIGPGKGAGRHTNPAPFNPDFGENKWTLFKYEEVKNTKDFIAAYVKR